MLRAFVVSVLVVPAVFGQQAISVRSGLLHHVEGKATLEDVPVNLRFGAFPIMKDGTTLKTDAGHVELLLTPGTFLRMDNLSSVKMISNKLTDTVVELKSGSALVEIAGLEKEYKVTIRAGEASTSLMKQGLYRFDGNPARVRVYEGRAEVSQGREGMTLTKGKEALLGPVLLAGKFSVKDMDELYTWSQNRAATVAQANLVAARSMQSNGFRNTMGMWTWSPYYGSMTFMPRSGMYHSIFGYYFYSPAALWMAYPNRGGGYNNGGGNYGGGAQQSAWSGMSSSGNNSPSYSSGSVSSSGRAAVSTSAPAQSAPSGGRGR